MSAADHLISDPDQSRESGGSRALQISNAIGHVHKQFVGRGPTSVRTQIGEDVIVCVLEGGLTQAEQTVWDHAGEDAVIDMRLHLQEAMKRAIVAAVEGILGRRVRSFMSANDPERDLQAEIMLLEPEAGLTERGQEGTPLSAA